MGESSRLLTALLPAAALVRYQAEEAQLHGSFKKPWVLASAVVSPSFTRNGDMIRQETFRITACRKAGEERDWLTKLLSVLLSGSKDSVWVRMDQEN